MNLFRSLLNGIYAFIFFNILYFVGRGLIYLLDVIRGLNEDLIQGIGIECIAAYLLSYITLQNFATDSTDNFIAVGETTKQPIAAYISFMALIILTRFFVFEENNFFFYLKDSLTMNIISVVLIGIGGFIGVMKE